MGASCLFYLITPEATIGPVDYVEAKRLRDGVHSPAGHDGEGDADAFIVAADAWDKVQGR